MRSYSLENSFFFNNVWKLDSALCWAQAPPAVLSKEPPMLVICENEHKICIVLLEIFADFKEGYLVVVPSCILLYLEAYCATKTALSSDGKELFTN